MANISINELSSSISELVDLDTNQQGLVESAIARAISAQEAKNIVGGSQALTMGGYFPHWWTPIVIVIPPGA